MKKILYICIILAICIGIVSCGESNDPPSGKVEIAAVEDIGEYKVVRSENASESEKASAVALHQAIYKVIDSVKITTDYNSTSKEILVGNTNRAESIEAAKGLRYYDYVIKNVGSKIVVVGGSDEALTKAVELFKANFIDTEAKTVKIPINKEGYKYTENYTMDRFTIDNVDISEFQLYNKSLMNIDEILPKLRKAFGIDITVEPDKMIDGTHYIILDGSELIADKYSITIENSNIVICGSAHSLPTAVDTFTGSYLDSLGSKEYNLTAADTLEASTGKKEVYTKDQLMTVLKEVYDDPEKIIIGEETNGTVNCITYKLEEFYNATGEYPGIIGIDLACYGVDLLHKTDVEWSAIICEIVDYCANGGIITMSAHWDNPSGNTMGDARCRGELGYEDSLEAYEQAFTDLLTDGTEYNAIFKNEITENARFLKALGDNGVPVIWRPLHEANGGWFWFCTRQGTNHTLDPKYIVGVWQYVHDYFTKEMGLTNLIWCYAPNTSSNVDNDPSTTMSTTYLYPGDEYCDMVGVDWYSSGNLEITDGDNYLRLTDLARKPGAITEFGPSGAILAEDRADQPKLYDSMNLYGDLYSLSKEGCSFAYLLTWGGKWGIPVMGKGEEFMDQEMTLGQADVKALLDALK